MAEAPVKLKLYQAIWTILLNDAGFVTPSGAVPDENNQIRVDNGLLQPNKTTVAQEGDLHEIELQPGEDTDEGALDDEENRPTFCEVEGGTEGEQIVTFTYLLYIRHPDKRYEENVALAQRARMLLRGYKLRKAGHAYAGNTSVNIEYDPEADVRGTVRPQHTLTIDVQCTLNPSEV